MRQPADNSTDCGVCALLFIVGTLIRVPRPGNLLSAEDKKVGGSDGPQQGYGADHAPALTGG